MMAGWITVLIVLALAALAALCLVSFLRRLSGKKSCCEGAAKRTPAKKLARVSGTFIVRISGMHCARCQENVTRAINTVPGHAAKVDLARREAVVSYQELRDRKSVV